MRVQKCRGTRDLSPAEMTRFRLIEGTFRDRCIRGGYEEVRTPTLEYLHLFTSTGTLTPGTLGKVYSFLDWDGWSGERVVLRPDGTIPVARSYIEGMSADGLAKLYYVANIFIFEETGKEARERWQCGVEMIGAGSTLADVEMIMLARDVLESLGLENATLKLSHAGLIRALLTRFGLTAEEQAGVIDRILDGDDTVLTGLRPPTPELGETLTPLLDLTGQSPGFLHNLKAVFERDLPEFGPALDNFIEIVDMLDALGYDYRIDIASGRGFEYYTGVIFQFLAGEERVAGGGRYDALIPLMGGNEIPASGLALYLDRLMGLISPDVLDGRLPDRVLIRTEAGNQEAIKQGFGIADRIREAGYAAEMDLGGQPTAGVAWLLDIGGAPPGFTLTGCASGRQSPARTADEVLTLLGASRAG